MFKLLNTYNKDNLILRVSYNGANLDFFISALISKRNKNELAPEEQFLLLNNFIKYKGPEFEKELFRRISHSFEVLNDLILQPEILPLPLSIVHDVIDMFDTEEMFHYLKEVARIKIPSILKDTFDSKIEEDGLGTRVQTFIKDDYVQLATLVTILKSVIGIISQFAYIKAKDLGVDHRELILLLFLKTHPIYDYPAFVKIRGMIEMIIKSVTTNAEENSIRIIERNIPSEDLPEWILAVTLFQKVILSSIVDDTNEKNVITKIHNFVTNKLKLKAGTSNTIRVKKPMLDVDSGDGDQESIIESYRLVTDLMVGTIVELEWAVSDIEFLIQELKPDMDRKHLDLMFKERERIINHGLTEAHIIILGWVYKNVIDPRSLPYIGIDYLVNMAIIAHVYLWENDMKELAIWITAVKDNSTDGIVHMNSTVNRSRIPKEMKDELDRLFPYQRVKVSTKENKYTNPAEDSINLLANHIYNGRWILTAPEEYIIYLTGSSNKIFTAPADLKIYLAKLVIFLNS